MNNKKSRVSFLSVIALSIMTSASANAELYVSPVVKKSVKIKHEEVVSVGNHNKVRSIQGNSNQHGDFLIKERSDVDLAVMRFGKNVPLFVAFDKVIPESKDWTVHFDSGLENFPVDWEGGNDWEGVLKAISEQNDIDISVNYEEMAIGVARESDLAFHLAKKIPEVWRLKTDKSVRGNLESWAAKAGWKIAWDKKLRIDYPVIYSATFTGGFEGKGGVVDQLILSLANEDVPLKAAFYEGNSVVLITEAGFTQEVLF
jgi:hypothetical protein